MSGTDKYQAFDLIGQGTYGRVFKVSRKSDGKTLVLKTILFDGV